MDNRAEILKCALRLFAGRGYDAVGVQEIVDAAGVTKPTLYHYFGSKWGLLQTLLSDSFGELNPVVASAATYAGDLPLTLEKVTKAYFEFADRHPLFYRLQLALWFAPPESEGFRAVSALNRKQQHILENMFVQAAADHGNMRGRRRAYATTFMGMINTHIGLMLNGYLQLDEGLVRRAIHQYMYGIFS